MKADEWEKLPRVVRMAIEGEGYASEDVREVEVGTDPETRQLRVAVAIRPPAEVVDVEVVLVAESGKLKRR